MENTESSYDEDLMIFGNENGYGPAYGQNIQVQKTSGKCDCDNTVNGICFKSDKTGVLGCTSGTLAPAPTSTVGKEKKPKTLKQRCREAGGTMGTCYANGSNSGYPCCSMATHI
jgi:hypothetical protein